jgi:hypothetical protein
MYKDLQAESETRGQGDEREREQLSMAFTPTPSCHLNLFTHAPSVNIYYFSCKFRGSGGAWDAPPEHDASTGGKVSKLGIVAKCDRTRHDGPMAVLSVREAQQGERFRANSSIFRYGACAGGFG